MRITTERCEDKIRTLESLEGSTWILPGERYALKVIDAVGSFKWIRYDGKDDHTFCFDPPRKIFHGNDLHGYCLARNTPDDPHAETDF